MYFNTSLQYNDNKTHYITGENLFNNRLPPDLSGNEIISIT